MAFISDDDLKVKLANQLHVPSTALTAADWPTIIKDCNAAAKNELLSKLRARGYSLDQIQNQWSRVEEFQTDIGLYWCMVKGANLNLHSADPTFIDKLDRRKELDTLMLLDANGDPIVIVLPGQLGGEASAGVMDTTDDHFTYDMYL